MFQRLHVCRWFSLIGVYQLAGVGELDFYRKILLGKCFSAPYRGPAHARAVITLVFQFRGIGRIIDESRQYFPGGYADMTGHLPAVGLARYVLLSVNGMTNTLVLTDGSDFAPFPPSNPATRIPQCPSGSFPITAVYLLDTTTEVAWEELFDVRLMVGGGINTTVPGLHHLMDSTVHDDTITNILLTYGDMIYANNSTPSTW